MFSIIDRSHRKPLVASVNMNNQTSSNITYRSGLGASEVFINHATHHLAHHRGRGGRPDDK